MTTPENAPARRFNRFYTDAYNTRRGLPDGLVDDILQRTWPARSEAARRAVTCVRDVPYGEHPRQTVDLFPAAESADWLVFIHGGYWKGMAGAQSSFVAPPLLAAGYNVAVPTYRLCPEVAIGAIIEDCAAAIAWVYAHAAAYSAGCRTITVAGHSAGGHLTAAMFTVDWAARGVPVTAFAGGIALSGLFDLDPIRQCEMNEVLGLTHEDVAQWSPARRRPTVHAPLVLVDGARESDEFHRQMQVLAGAPGWDAVVADVISLAERHHFDLLEDFLDVTHPLWRPLNG